MRKCKRPLENYLQHYVFVVLHCLGLWKIFPKHSTLSTKMINLKDKGRLKFIYLTHCVTKDRYYKQDSSSKLRPTYSTELYEVLKGPGLNYDHKQSGSILRNSDGFLIYMSKMTFSLRPLIQESDYIPATTEILPCSLSGSQENLRQFYPP